MFFINIQTFLYISIKEVISILLTALTYHIQSEGHLLTIADVGNKYFESLLLQQEEADIYFDRNAFDDFDKCRGSYSQIFAGKIVRKLLGNFKELLVMETFFIKVGGFKFETWQKKCFVTNIFLGIVENF